MLPLVDVGELLRPGEGGAAGPRREVARRLDQACRRYGFVRITGHGVPPGLQERLTRAARAFFALPEEAKEEIAMARAGAAWRGWFPVGAELTSGLPDAKEGLYFGEELPADDPRVLAGLPLHGPNLFPEQPADLRPSVLAWMAAMTGLGQALLRGMATGLGMDEGWFAEHVTADPTTLFRIFHYPPGAADEWGVREHTDYGLLTILAQDGTPGLEVHGPDGWLAVPPDPDVLVVNLGDMLERMTGGLYRSTPHRVRNDTPVGRLSFPFFLDPSWSAEVEPMPLDELSHLDASAGHPRWDGADVHAWEGTYGEYLTTKVSRVFPALRARRR
jgi:isopenicillin N synthase-like dioxygenase